MSVTRPVQTDYAGPQASTAYLVRNPEPLWPKPFEAFRTAGQALVRQDAVRDPDLTNLDQMSKIGGSALIATLTTMSSRMAGLGIGEFLGFASFFTAMGVVPKALNHLFYLTKGVNLAQQFKDSHGVQRDLYEDNQYRPDLLPDEEVEILSKQFGYPEGPAQRRLTMDRVWQMSVQSRTWWMLVAGPASVALGGLMSHVLEPPLRSTSGRLQRMRHFQQAASAGTAQQMQTHLNAGLERVLGRHPNAQLSLWWRRFGETILRESGLSRMIPLKQIVGPRQDLNDLLVDHLSELVAPSERMPNGFQRLLGSPRAPGSPGMTPATRTAIERTLKRLNQEKQYLYQERDHLLRVLEERKPQFETLLARDFSTVPPDIRQARMVDPYFQRLSAKIREAFATPISTVTHHQRLFETMRDLSNRNALKDEARRIIRPMMEDAHKSAVLEALDDGQLRRASQLASGNFRLLKQVALERAGQSMEALQWGGQSPSQGLIDALKELASSGLYRRYVLMTLGAVSLGTLIFNEWVLGKSFKQPTEQTS